MNARVEVCENITIQACALLSAIIQISQRTANMAYPRRHFVSPLFLANRERPANRHVEPRIRPTAEWAAAFFTCCLRDEFYSKIH